MTGKNRIMKTARGQPFPLAHRCASSQCIWGWLRRPGERYCPEVAPVLGAPGAMRSSRLSAIAG
jgi:hypothetical protein